MLCIGLGSTRCDEEEEKSDCCTGGGLKVVCGWTADTGGCVVSGITTEGGTSTDREGSLR